MRANKNNTALTHVGHVVHAVAGPLAPDDPDRHAGDAEEHYDGHTEANHQTQVSHQRLQSTVLFLKRFQPPKLFDTHSTELLSPVIECLLADTQLTADLFNW